MPSHEPPKSGIWFSVRVVTYRAPVTNAGQELSACPELDFRIAFILCPRHLTLLFLPVWIYV
jgi:hypothetical protein